MKNYKSVDMIFRQKENDPRSAFANAFYRKAGFRFTHTEENALELRGESKALNWYEIKKP